MNTPEPTAEELNIMVGEERAKQKEIDIWALRLTIAGYFSSLFVAGVVVGATYFTKQEENSDRRLPSGTPTVPRERPHSPPATRQTEHEDTTDQPQAE